MEGLFGSLFDFNNDGKVDTFEQVAEFATFASIMEADEAEEQKTELEMSGLDINELEFMDSDERREALDDAGLDPDDYDF
ncbi:MAG: hypothetical protein PHX08_03770 [Lachnospiraceae bacterium]|nr:hypothetical protein [Lachnospiraceae bacterium]